MFASNTSTALGRVPVPARARVAMPFMACLAPALAVLVCLVLVQGCSHTGTPLKQGAEIVFDSTTFSFDKDTYPSADNLFPGYQLTPGDVLDVFFQIRTWEKRDTFLLGVDDQISVKFINAPELNELQFVQPDGSIFLPYIGEVAAAGRTVSDLTADIKRRYNGILRDTEILVTVPQFRSSINQLREDLRTAPRGLSRLVTIRPDGYCTFPLVGDLYVAKMTIPDVNAALDTRYEQYLPGLNADLFLHQYAGSLVYVLGEVTTAGAYSIQKPITVLQALALAGGHTRQANLNGVAVFRRNGGKVVGTWVDLDAALNNAEEHMFFNLKPDDMVYVPRLQRSTMAEIMRDVADIFLFDRWSIGLTGPLYERRLIGPANPPGNPDE